MSADGEPTVDGGAAPAAPATPATAAPAGPSAADMARARQAQAAFVSMASARTPEEFAAAQASARALLGVQSPAAEETVEDDPYSDAAIRAAKERVLRRFEGEDDAARESQLLTHEELGDYLVSKRAPDLLKRAESLAEKKARKIVAEIFDGLGITPEELQATVVRGRASQWDDAVRAAGEGSREHIPAAEKLMRQFAAAGEPIDRETALAVAARKAGGAAPAKPAAPPVPPRPARSALFSSGPEEGPVSKVPEAARAANGKPMSNAEILRSFLNMQADQKAGF